jgi:clan AA aspartic protease
MGTTFADIRLTNSEDLLLLRKGYVEKDEVRSIQVKALVDTGASLLTIPLSIQKKLGLSKIDEQNVEMGDGSIITVDIVGPIELRFENRVTIVTAAVLPTEVEVLLGIIPMQYMDVLIDPRRERLIVNPQSPDKARMFLKGNDRMLSDEQLKTLRLTGKKNAIGDKKE